MLQCRFCFMFWFFWPWSMWDLSFPAGYGTHTLCAGRQSLYHWTTREVPGQLFLKSRWDEKDKVWAFSSWSRAPSLVHITLCFPLCEETLYIIWGISEIEYGCARWWTWTLLRLREDSCLESRSSFQLFSGIPRRQPTPVLLFWKFRGWRSLVGCSP